MSELTFIDSIKKQQPALPAGCLGVGDDAAIIEPGKGGWVIATDMIVEGRHFDPELHRMGDIGHKALAINLSDLAAMGATPRYALVSIAVPEGIHEGDLNDLWSGLQNLAKDYDIAIIGGDTNSWNSGLVINVCVLGEPHPDGSILRSGAKPGDELFVTDCLGASIEFDHHLRFRPKVKEAHQIIELVRPNAMIDISDGLATDLKHICTASEVGATLASKNIPISPRIPLSLPDDIRLRRAMTDGEDFELLFALPPGKGQFLRTLPFTCYRIGTVTNGREIILDGKPLAMAGFEHSFQDDAEV